MSLLEQGTREKDNAAEGEELTKGSGNALLAAVVAAVVVSVAIFVYVKMGQKPPAATGEVSNLVAHMIHRETSGLDAAGAPMPKEVFDQVLIFAHVKLHNQSKQPLFLHQIMANATLNDGIHTSYAASPTDYERIFQGYPELAALHGKPIASETTIEAGQTLEGDFVSALRLSKAEWDARKSLDFTFGFRYQPNLVVTPASPVSDQ